MKTRFLILPSFIVAVACSAGGGPEDPNSVGGPTAGTGSTPHSASGGSGNLIITELGGTGQLDPNDTRELPLRELICTNPADPATCSCLSVALIGTLDSAANNKDTGPFVDWLNANSGGTAKVTMVSQKPTIDAAWLSQYDVIISANINGNDWTFSAAEKAAIEEWARTTGGGILSLTGFTSEAGEPAATSQLIEWSGVRYNATRTAENGQQIPVYYNGGTTDLKNCLAWTGGSDAIITTPINFAPLTGTMERLTFELDYVGAYIGFGVDAPAEALVVSTDPVSGANMAVAHEVDHTGRVLAFGDEWIIFANQWVPVGNPPNQQPDQYNICWVPPEERTTFEFHSVQSLYQTKQFWYNAISWVAPPNECFVIDDPEVEIPEIY
jgi:hypothetical protein